MQLCALKKEWRPARTHIPYLIQSRPGGSLDIDSGGFSDNSLAQFSGDSLELRKIKKVQSFFRGWLCRRRWKQIVEQYIKSPHAESMRKRNR